MKRESLLYKYISIAPPFIILFYLYTKNTAYINYWLTLAAALMFALLSLVLYAAIAQIGKPSGGRAALLTAVFWVISIALLPLYKILPFSKPVRYIIVILIVLATTVVVFMYGKRIRRKEVFTLIAVFESVLLLLNIFPATIRFAAGEGVRGSSLSIKTSDFTVNPASPSPNIYWFFMDGMLGFKGMETLFDDRQAAFTAELEERGFLINRDAEFEVGHATMRATPALFSPAWYDTVFLPLLETVDLSDYEDKRRKIGKFDTTNGRANNEFITAFNAGGYMTYAINRSGLIHFHNMFLATIKKHFAYRHIISLKQPNLIFPYTQMIYLNFLLGEVIAPYTVTRSFWEKLINLIYINVENTGSMSVPQEDKNAVYGEVYSGTDVWFVGALAEIFTEQNEPRLVIVHDTKAHVQYDLDENGARVRRSVNEGLNPSHYPPEHRYVARVLIAYIDLILKNDPDAVIVAQADHGLQYPETRAMLLAAGKTEDDVRVMQNSVISAVRIPERWGGLDQPVDPLNISRVLINRYVGENYVLLETHP
jgi:hypothetical protein